MNKALHNRDAMLMEEPVSTYDYFAILEDSTTQRRASRKETTFPQTTTGMIGWRLGKPASRLDIFKHTTKPLGDIYKTLNWPRGSSE